MRGSCTWQDALGELANVAIAYAAANLATILGTPVSQSMSHVRLGTPDDAVQCLGEPVDLAAVVTVPVDGQVDGFVALVMTADDVRAACVPVGARPGSELARSFLCELGNMLACGFLAGLHEMAGLDAMPCPAQFAEDGVVPALSSCVAEHTADAERLLMMHGTLAGETLGAMPCVLDVVFVVDGRGTDLLLHNLGVAA